MAAVPFDRHQLTKATILRHREFSVNICVRIRLRIILGIKFKAMASSERSTALLDVSGQLRVVDNTQQKWIKRGPRSITLLGIFLFVICMSFTLPLAVATPQYYREECSSSPKSGGNVQLSQSRVLLIDVIGHCSDDLKANLDSYLRSMLSTSSCGGNAQVDYHRLQPSSTVDANLLSTYSQVWVLDFSSGSDPYTSAWDAISAWYLQRNTGDIIVDSRVSASALRSRACLRRGVDLETPDTLRSASQALENYFVREGT